MEDRPKHRERFYRQPDIRVRVWRIACADLDEATGFPVDEQRGEYGTSLDVHLGAPDNERYAVNGTETDRDTFAAMLEVAKLRQLKRIARALEKLAGIDHDEPTDPLDPVIPKCTASAGT